MKFSRTVMLITLTMIVLIALNSSLMALPIISLPQATSGPFRHNVFHKADAGGGAGATAILGWFDLDTSQSSLYDPNTGQLALYIKIFDNSGLNTGLIGTAVGTSSNLLGSGFNGFTGVANSLGTIDWEFTLSTTSDLKDHLLTKGLLPGVGDIFNITLKYLDKNYVTSSAGHTANTWQDGYLTLWGADEGAFTGTGNGFNDDNTILGSDIVMQAIPEPGTFALLSFGVLGLIGYCRQRQRKV